MRRSLVWVAALTVITVSVIDGQSGTQMVERGYRRVTLPAKPGATPSVSEAARDSIEHLLHCQCGGCRHDVFACRTNDLMCSVGPQMHRDIDSMIAGGHTPPEIVAAFQEQYGEAVLMAPPKRGFNWVGYLLPFGVIAAGAVLVWYLLRSWTTRAPTAASAGAFGVSQVDASPDELARLREALRRDE